LQICNPAESPQPSACGLLPTEQSGVDVMPWKKNKAND